MFQLFIFDLGGVLFTNGTKRLISHICKKYSLEEKIVSDVMDGELGTLYRENQISKNDFWERAIEKMKIRASVDELNNYWIDGYELIEGTRDIILYLKKNYKVYYLSDNVKERVHRLEDKYHFLKWFNGGVFSYEVDIRKPDPKIYELVLQKTQVDAQKAIFVDDKGDALLPAKKMGMKTILFQNPNQLKYDLQKVNIF